MKFQVQTQNKTFNLTISTFNSWVGIRLKRQFILHLIYMAINKNKSLNL